MRAKFINEDIEDILKPKELTPELQKQWKEGGNFREIARRYEEEGDVGESADFENYSIDYDKKIISFNHTWSDDEYECDINVDIDFRKQEIRYKGECKNEDIEVPGPGYMVPFEYDNQQTDTFDNSLSYEQFVSMLNDEVSDWFGNFSYFAQQEGESEEDKEYCEECGDEECEKCEDCGRCPNSCECDYDED